MMHLQIRSKLTMNLTADRGVLMHAFMMTCLTTIALIVSPQLVRAEPSQTPSQWTAATPPLLPAPALLLNSNTITVAGQPTHLVPSESAEDINWDGSADDSEAESVHPASPIMQPPASLSADLRGDRFWLINTRSMSSNTFNMNLNQPNFRIERLDRCGNRRPSSLDDYISSMDPTRPRIIYVHGHRREAPVAITQGMYIYQQVARHRVDGQPFDWVIWSWPSEGQSILMSDVREKAMRTNAQGLYVAWLLREHHQHSQPTGLIGFSFGARVVSGALHALAGGSLGSRTIGEPAITGANIDVGFLAPALDNRWMAANGYHRLATQNLNRLLLLYNDRDFALKYFRLISQDPRSEALGHTGPRCFAPRHDGTPLQIRSLNCANTVGNHHSEKTYYEQSCYAGREMSSLLQSVMLID